jgi:hypothetical protein
MTLLIYAGIAIAFLGMVLALLLRARSENTDEGVPEKDYAPCVDEARWLNLSECIFNPADARWLRDELSFPGLALSLTRARQQLAIQWLKALQASFNTLVRTTALSPLENPGANSMEGWRLLWLTVRFQFLLSYALMIVKFFGPYHRLIPSFAWVPFLKESEPPLHDSILAGNGDLH